ncbi:phosphotransferase enzyme family protein [Halomonas sp. HNIBRBA4712]|uniref:phosphotransferase enzyme family protein n=1 Tax=Halomonas sp. HNIBRBA4712 TaxID=3373087 RepID=UPI0037468133
MSAEQYDTLDNAALTRLAEQAMTRYEPHLQGEVALLCRSENATFVLTVEGRRHALRLHRANYHQKADIESELAWLDALRETGIQVPEAIADAGGERVLTLALPDGSERHAVLFHWMEGEMPTTEVDPRSFHQLGRITAKLHEHSRGWPQPEGFQRIVWNHDTMVGPEGHWGDWRDAPGLSLDDKSVVEKALRSIDEAMAGFGKDASRYGLIHADLRLTNLLMHEGETRVIDFDDCGMGWYLHDLAAAISFEEHHPNAEVWVEQWLKGYEEVITLSEEERAIIPSMLIQRRIQMTAWMASHADTEMARSLGSEWVGHTVRLCKRYLEGKRLPIGA